MRPAMYATSSIGSSLHSDNATALSEAQQRQIIEQPVLRARSLPARFCGAACVGDHIK